jgi:hypothetical protein
VLMLLGAFGPWVKALGQSVGGTDGSNDGWLVVAAAALGGLLFYLARSHRAAATWPVLGGVAGLVITIHDRNNVQHAIDQGGAFAQALASVGWGLNLALLASASMTLAGLVWAGQKNAVDGQSAALPPPTSPPPAIPTGPMTAPPPLSSPPEN